MLLLGIRPGRADEATCAATPLCVLADFAGDTFSEFGGGTVAAFGARQLTGAIAVTVVPFGSCGALHSALAGELAACALVALDSPGNAAVAPCCARQLMGAIAVAVMPLRRHCTVSHTSTPGISPRLAHDLEAFTALEARVAQLLAASLRVFGDVWGGEVAWGCAVTLPVAGAEKLSRSIFFHCRDVVQVVQVDDEEGVCPQNRPWEHHMADNTMDAPEQI